MKAEEIRFFFGYDRWATRRVLNAAQGIDAETWSRPNAVGERGLGGILVHALGAHARWRNAWQARDDKPRPEREPLLSPADLRLRWEAEWGELDDYVAGLTDADVVRIWDGLPIWQTMVHVVNHGTQHRSEAAVLLTAAGSSPGELDMTDFMEERDTA
jgi:uncharacterized damage-inducible protein DinB